MNEQPYSADVILSLVIRFLECVITKDKFNAYITVAQMEEAQETNPNEFKSAIDILRGEIISLNQNPPKPDTQLKE